MKKNFIAKIVVCLCMIFSCVFCFASCETTYSMNQVVTRLNNVINNNEISVYFSANGFNYNATSIKQKVGENAMLDNQIDCLNYSMIVYNHFKSMIEGSVIQKDAKKSDSTILYKTLEKFYFNLRNQHAARLLIENNSHFDINNTQDQNEFNQWYNRLKETTKSSIEVNIALINTLDNALYSKIDLLKVKNPTSLTPRTYESKILKAYTIMLKYTSEIFLNELDGEKLYVYGSDGNQGFESFSDVLKLGEILLKKDAISFNTLTLEQMQHIMPNLNYLNNVYSFTNTSINSFNFNSLANNVEKIYNEYTAENLTKYLNNNVSVTEKANYNFVIQEMQNYKNIVAMIKNLFY